jgi:hypothetical protein
MSSLLLLNVLDIARSLGSEPRRATPQDVADWLLQEYARKRGGGFNYNPAINALYDLFRGASSQDQAEASCKSSGNPKGRAQNVAAINCVAPYALNNVSTCYRADFTAVAIGRVKDRTVYAAIKAPMVRVVHDEVFVVMPGFRLSHRPVGQQIDVACSIALANFARDDFGGADFEYLDTGVGLSKERELQAIRGRDRHVYGSDDVDSLLDVYVQGVALALETGLEVRDANLRGYRVVDPSQPAMFR